MSILSENLKRFRQEKHMTQASTAEALGISTQTRVPLACATTLPDAARCRETLGKA